MPKYQPSPEEHLPDRLISDAEFEELIERKLVGQTIRLTVTSVDGDSVVATYTTSNVPDTDSSQSRTYFEDGGTAIKCRCEMWPTTTKAGEEPDKVMSELAELVRLHWGERDPATMLPFVKIAGVPARFAAAARYVAGNSPVMAVLHTDLDHFKKVNDEVGETGGDAVLREFSDRLREDFGHLGVIVRTGGEEFSALLYDGGIEDFIAGVVAFRHRMENEPLCKIDRPNTCSIGLSIFTELSRFADVKSQDEVLSEARTAEVRAKRDGRNRIALSDAPPEEQAHVPVKAADLQFAALLGRRNYRDDFGDTPILLAAIQKLLRNAFVDGKGILESIAQVRDELSLKVGSYKADRERAPELLGWLKSLDWATMVISALFEAARSNQTLLKPTLPIVLKVDKNGELSLEINGTDIPLNCRVDVETAMQVEAGRPMFEAGHSPIDGITRDFSSTQKEDDWQSPVLLLPIGDAAKDIADRLRGLTASVVDVDDRPTRGGGLPDFWQSNVSRVVRACLENPNIGTVIAIGDTKNAALTIDRLTELSTDGNSTMFRSLAMNAEHLETFLKRGIVVRLVTADFGEVVTSIAEAVGEMKCYDFGARPIVDTLMASRRHLPIAAPNQEHRLETIDGLRTRGLADAYPETLQLIRGANDSLDHEEPQRGTFREMTSFKVVLTEPLVDRVPDYWFPHQSLLDDYYQRSFANKDALFGKKLLAAHGDGSEPMIQFAVDATVNAATRGTPTRRINLPIVSDALDQPLGLSCIQLMPRIREDNPLLDPIFVWRTVDALVGFPFSAYGSIRWSEDFIALVNAKLEKEPGGKRMRIGTLTYVALSFHMYLHDGDKEIARTIVQDASL